MIIDLQKFIVGERRYWTELEGMLDVIENEPAHRMNLEQVKRFLDGFENLQSTGSLGTFAYPRMHGAMRMGATAAEAVLTSSREKVGQGHPEDS